MCEYCEEPKRPIEEQGNFGLWMLGADLVINHSFGQTLAKIHYCPMCGKKLSAQEVEPYKTQTE